MEYQIIRKKIKNVYIHVKDGVVFISAPYRLSETQIQKLVTQKKGWIEKQFRKQESENKQVKNEFILLGKSYPINTLASNSEYIEFTGSNVNIYLNDNADDKISKLINQLYRKCAQKQYIITTQKMMGLTGLRPNSWRIRDIKSAWGSCSSKRNITLSLNLVTKREEVIEYVVLHELCHLKHMNHSKDFWNLVGKYMPDYKVYRKELKV